MPDKRVQILVIGSGLCGLAVAATAARRGFQVRCIGDGRPGASLANFGQLHSGAVYAPVLPDVARACWLHRDRWRELALTAQIGEPHGHALFSTADAVDTYRAAWRQIGIDVQEVDPRNPDIMTAYPPPVAAFRIPDLSVDLGILHANATALAMASGVPPVEHGEVRLHRDPNTTLVSTGTSNPRADLVVLATGADTPTMLNNAGITHTLRQRRIAWGRYTAARPTCLTYWLDGDLLAISPDTAGARIGLPSVNGSYDTSEVEYSRIRGRWTISASIRLTATSACTGARCASLPTPMRTPLASWWTSGIRQPAGAGPRTWSSRYQASGQRRGIAPNGS